MGNINFDQASTGTTTGQPHTLTVIQKTPVFPELKVPMTALWARCDAGNGVLGESFSVDGTGAGSGVHGRGSINGVFGETTNKDASGVYGQNDGGGFGVAGSSPGGTGVAGRTRLGVGVNGQSDEGTGVLGETRLGVGVSGQSDEGAGVLGRSRLAAGVSGQTHSSEQSAIFGMNLASVPVPGGLNYPAGNGVWGHTKTPNGSGVCGSVEPNTQAAGVTGIGPTAGQFFGNVVVNGSLTVDGVDILPALQKLIAWARQTSHNLGQSPGVI